MAVNMQKVDKKSAMSWMITLGLPAIILCTPSNEILTSSIKLYCAITLMAILMFAFENVNQTAVALILPVMYIITGITTPAIAFSSWSSFVVWMILGGLIIAEVLNSIGLLKRIAYKCIILTGASYKGILYGLGLAGVVLNIIIPGQAVIPLAALSFGICRALNLGRSKEAGGIMLTASLGAMIPMLFLFNPGPLIIYGMAEPVVGKVPVSWLGFLFNNGVSILLLFIMTFIATKMFKPDKEFSGKEFFLEEYKKLGKLTTKEKKGSLVCFGLFLFLLTGNWHGIDLGWGFLLFAVILFLPKINVGDKEDLQRINFGFIIFVASCLSIGTVATSLGIGQIVAGLAMPLLAGKSITFVLMFVWILCVVLNFVLTPLAMYATFTVPLTEIIVNLGINPEALFMVMAHGGDQILMPYEYAYYLIYFSFGLIYLKDFMKLMGAKIIVDFIFVFVVLVPYWKLIGFLVP